MHDTIIFWILGDQPPVVKVLIGGPGNFASFCMVSYILLPTSSFPTSYQQCLQPQAVYPTPCVLHPTSCFLRPHPLHPTAVLWLMRYNFDRMGASKRLRSRLKIALLLSSTDFGGGLSRKGFQYFRVCIEVVCPFMCETQEIIVLSLTLRLGRPYHSMLVAVRMMAFCEI